MSDSAGRADSGRLDPFSGLSEAGILVLRAVLVDPHASEQELASRIGADSGRVGQGLSELKGLGLLKPSQVTRTGWRVVHPRVAIGSLIAEREAVLSHDLTVLSHMRDALQRLSDEYAAANDALDGENVTQFQSRDEVLNELGALVTDVRQEVVAFVTTKPSRQASAEGRHVDGQLLDRGVTLRSICLDSFRRDKATMKDLLFSMETGVQVRTSPTLPSRMIIFDRRAAVIANDPADPGRGALVVRSNPTVVLLYALFDRLWHDSVPLNEPPEEPDADAPQPMELAVLRLLAVGHKDEAIARATGQSARTVRRIISGMCDRLGARGRFDLALRASSRGWL